MWQRNAKPITSEDFFCIRKPKILSQLFAYRPEATKSNFVVSLNIKSLFYESKHMVSCIVCWFALRLELLSDWLSMDIKLTNQNWDSHSTMAQIWWCFIGTTKKKALKIMSPQQSNLGQAGIVCGNCESTKRGKCNSKSEISLIHCSL